MKIKVDCKDNTTPYIRVGKNFTQKNNGYGYEFRNENDELVLTVSHDAFKAVSYWPDSYTEIQLQNEKREAVQDLLNHRIRDISFDEVLPSNGRFSVKNAKGRNWACLVSETETDEFSTLAEVFEIPRFFVTTVYTIPETELEDENVRKIVYALTEQLREKLVDSTELLNLENTTSVRFGEPRTKSWLENDNWNWNVMAAIEVAIFGEKE